MKTVKSWGKVLPIAALCCAVVGGSASYTKPAYSCSYWKPWTCLGGGGGTNPADWAYDAASGIGNWFKDIGKGIGQFAVRDLWGNYITRFSCPFTTFNAFGTRLACFSSDAMETNRVLGSLDFIATDKRNDFTYVTMSNGAPAVHSFAPSSFTLGRIAYILNGFASEAQVFTLDMHDANADASATVLQTGMSAPVIVWPSAYDKYTTQAGLAGVLVHEADHTRFGSHTCGKWGDNDEDGPYGTEIQYLAKIWKTGHPKYTLPALDRDLAWDKAVAKIGQLCHVEAQRRVWNTHLINTPNATTNSVLAAARTSWQRAAPDFVTDISVLADGRIYGLSTEGAVHVAASAGENGLQTTPPNVTHISVTPSGSIYGIGTDNAVYRSPGGRWVPERVGGIVIGQRWTLGTWTLVAPPWVEQLSVPTDDFIYGVGSDHAVYRIAPGAGAWELVAPDWVESISVTPDGTIYGVTMDHVVARTTANRWTWDRVTPSSVSNISVTPDGFIYGVTEDNAVVVTRSNSSAWQEVAPNWVSKISVTPDGMIYGIGQLHDVFAHSSLH